MIARRLAGVITALGLCAACPARDGTRPPDAAAGEGAAEGADVGAEPGAPGEVPTEIPNRERAEAEARAALPPVPSAAPDFVARQKLVGRYLEHEFRAEVVLQKRGDTLTLIGLSPFGTKGFVLEQRGREVEYTSHMPRGRELAFPPVFILLDVHRSLWAMPPGATQAVLEPGGARVTDSQPDGGVYTREIFEVTHDGAEAQRTVTIEFEFGATYGVPPRAQLLRNHRYNYVVEVATVQHQPL